MMALSNETTLRPDAVSTASWFGEMNAPTPVTTSTLRCLASPLRPLVSFPTTEFFHAASLATSMESSPNTIPCSAISLVSAMTLAACSSAFDGIHPTLRQTPPRVSYRSTRTVFLPRSAARNAAEYPPGPEPSTTTSA